MTQVNSSDIPQHIAIIMDGNGRWAKARGLERTDGHRQGAETVRTILIAAQKAGVRYLTLYAFSTENWKRPKEEVDAIMNLLVFMLEKETEELHKNNVRLLTIGDIDELNEQARLSLRNSMEKTAGNTGITLIIALNYGSRSEILRATKILAHDCMQGKINPEDIDENCFQQQLYTHNIPEPDLLIRTSGEQRISNFLLWQLAYAELYFTPVTWPDFDEEEFHKALVTYASRERRYGMTGDQIITKQDKKN